MDLYLTSASSSISIVCESSFTIAEAYTKVTKN